MSHRLTVQPKAENDALRAYQWYESELAGLGLQFLDALDDGLERITANPLHYAELAGGVRRKLLEKFPFGLFYLFEDGEVIVISVMRHEQSPDIWKSRNDV